MDVLDKLNSYAQGYRDDDINADSVFAEAAAEVISELRAIRVALEDDGWQGAARDIARARSDLDRSER